MRIQPRPAKRHPTNSSLGKNQASWDVSWGVLYVESRPHYWPPLWPVRIKSHTNFTHPELSSRVYFPEGILFGLPFGSKCNPRRKEKSFFCFMSELHTMTWGIWLTLGDASWLGNLVCTFPNVLSVFPQWLPIRLRHQKDLKCSWLFVRPIGNRYCVVVRWMFPYGFWKWLAWSLYDKAG